MWPTRKDDAATSSRPWSSVIISLYSSLRLARSNTLELGGSVNYIGLQEPREIDSLFCRYFKLLRVTPRILTPAPTNHFKTVLSKDPGIYDTFVQIQGIIYTPSDTTSPLAASFAMCLAYETIE